MAEVVSSDGRVTYVPQKRQIVVNGPNTNGKYDKILAGSTTGRVKDPKTGKDKSANTYDLRSPKPYSTYSGGGGGRGGGGGTGGGGGGVGTFSSGPSAAERAAAQAAAAARSAANNAARSSANSDVDRFNAQISAALAKRNTNNSSIGALKGLVEGGHARTRDNALKTLDAALRDKLGRIQETFETSKADFDENLRDNEKTEHDASFANLANRAREKQDVVAQALSQGAGESDVLRSQLQALRNWSANQADVNRSFFDTRASINSGITDLNNSTKTGMENEERSTNAAKGQRWDEFWDAMGETYADLANLDSNNYLLGEEIAAAERAKGDSAGLLAWLDAGKNAEDYKPAKRTSTAATPPAAYKSPWAQKAADAAQQTWKDPGLSKKTREFEGAAQSTGTLNSATVWESATNAPSRKRPEGATLRKW